MEAYSPEDNVSMGLNSCPTRISSGKLLCLREKCLHVSNTFSLRDLLTTGYVAFWPTSLPIPCVQLAMEEDRGSIGKLRRFRGREEGCRGEEDKLRWGVHRLFVELDFFWPHRCAVWAGREGFVIQSPLLKLRNKWLCSKVLRFAFIRISWGCALNIASQCKCNAYHQPQFP